MKKIFLIILSIGCCTFYTSAQSRNTKVFTMFTSYGCGCTGSGGAPEQFMTQEQVLEALQTACAGIDLMEWKGTTEEAHNELENNKNGYDGVLIIGRISSNYRLAFTGLPTIVVYNLFEFMDGQPYHLFATGKFPEKSILQGGIDYQDMKILTAQLDRRKLSDPAVTEAMFNDLVYKIKLIKAVKELKETRILMVKNNPDEIIASVNYRGDRTQSFPANHNEQYIQSLKAMFDVEIVPVEPAEFFDTYKKIEIREAEATADAWIEKATAVEASRPEIIKTARGYLAMEALREKYDCNAVSTHIRTVSSSDDMKYRYNPGLGLELGFKTRGIQAVCQNYPDILLSQVLAYLLTGRPSMLGDFIYDVANSVEIILHCGIPVNPYGDEPWVPYRIRTHAESPVRDLPDEPGSSTGITAEWPADEPVTLWEIHTLNKKLRLHTGKIVNGHAIYTGGEDLDNVMCTAKVVVKHDDIMKIQQQFQPYLYGIHTNATMGDLRQQLKDVAVFLGLEVIETDR
jgi:hypothetical protein